MQRISMLLYSSTTTDDFPTITVLTEAAQLFQMEK